MLFLNFLIIFLGVAVVKSDDTTSENVEDHENFHLLPMNICGPIVHPASIRIIYGIEALPGEFPWMVFLNITTKNEINLTCGGSLISENYVLTAAHCVKNGSEIKARLGEHDLLENDCVGEKCQQEIQIEKFIVHEKFLPNDGIAYNDIALLRLQEPANFQAPNIKPICLPIRNLKQDISAAKPALVSGWVRDENYRNQSVLQKANVVMRHTELCRELNSEKEDFGVPYSKICTRSIDGESCDGNSGDPLINIYQINKTERYFLEGIVSYGDRNCLRKGGETVYTNIKRYTSWILNNMEE